RGVGHVAEAGVAVKSALLFLQRATRRALEAALDDEGADAVRIARLLFLGIAPGEDQEVVRHIRERNPHLLAREHVPIALFDGDRLDTARVAAGRRLGEAVGRNLLSLRLRQKIPLLLILGA